MSFFSDITSAFAAAVSSFSTADTFSVIPSDLVVTFTVVVTVGGGAKEGVDVETQGELSSKKEVASILRGVCRKQKKKRSQESAELKELDGTGEINLELEKRMVNWMGWERSGFADLTAGSKR